MTILVKIKHPYATGDKALEVIPYDPYTSMMYQPTILNPGSFEKEFCIHSNGSLIIREVPKVELPIVNG